MMKRSFQSILAILLVPAVVSCSSSTLINSNPQGSKLYVDGAYRGVTPYKYSDSKIVGSTTQLKLAKDGYDNLQTVLSKSERPDVGAIVGGCFFLFPFLWTMQYDSQHYYDLIAPEASTTNTTDSEVLEIKLQRLKKMLEQGTITQDEYTTLRKRAIDGAK